MCAELRILCTTDLHGHIWPHDYMRDAPDPLTGLATAARVIEQARAEVANCILVDNGDTLQGEALVDPEILQATNGLERTNPVIATMNALAYDAATLGNHDFNFGLPHLEHALKGARFPHVLANIVRSRGETALEDIQFLPPYVILNRMIVGPDGHETPIRIGIIGLAPPQIPIWESHALQGALQARGMLESARTWTTVMRDAGADLVVGLCHTGPGMAGAPADAEDAGIELAAHGGLDALVLGHNHQHLPGDDFFGHPAIDTVTGRICGIPAVMAGSAGRLVGVIDLALAHRDGSWSVTDARSSLRAQSQDASMPEALDTATRTAHRATRDEINRSVGETDAPIHGYFPFVAADPSLHLMADTQYWRARQLLLSSSHADLPLLSAVAPYRAGGLSGPLAFTQIGTGPILLRHLFGLAPFPNPVCVVVATGAQIRAWLERAASLYSQIDPGADDRDLFEPGFAAYNLDILYGLEYSIDLSRPARFDVGGNPLADVDGAGRIRTLRFRGQPVADNARFLVATSTYRSAGGGGFPMVADCPVIATADEVLRVTLANYIGEHSPIRLAPTQNWRFAEIGATALFDSHPDADPGLATGSAHRIEKLDVPPGGGFGRFRIVL